MGGRCEEITRLSKTQQGRMLLSAETIRITSEFSHSNLNLMCIVNGQYLSLLKVKLIVCGVDKQSLQTA